RLTFGRATLGASASRGYRRPPISDGKHAVGQREVWQLRSVIQNREQNAPDERGYVINLDVMQGWPCRNHHHEGAAALVIPFVQVVGEEVVNAVAAAVGGRAPGLRERVGNLQNPGNISNPVKSDGDVIDATSRTLIGLILGSEQNGISGLA